MSLPEFLLVKVLAYGGSLIRPEATGYGVVYFGEQMLKTKGDRLSKIKSVTVSGFGNVAWGVIKKIERIRRKSSNYFWS